MSRKEAVMRTSLFVVSALALAGAAAVQPARAQYRHDYRGQTITCESQDGRYARCGIPWDGGVRMVEQLSGSSCVRGQTWGERGHSVWVNNGCRARFAPAGYVGGGPGGWAPPPGWNRRFNVNCSSSGYNYQMCRVDVGRNGRVYLRRQTSSSACIEGRTWGWNRAGVWVNQGCAGEFTIDRRW